MCVQECCTASRTFKSVPARADEEAHEVDVGVLLLRNHHLVVHTDDRRPATQEHVHSTKF